MTREQQYWEDTQEALSRIFDRCEEIDPQSSYDMLEDIQFIRGFINKCKPRTEKQMSCSENPNKWIPVSERLPEREGWYLISLGEKTYGGADVDMYCKGWVKYGTHVLAWMPLPTSYQGEEND